MKKLMLIITLVALMITPALAVPSLGGWEEGAPRSTHQYWTFSGDHKALQGSEYAALPEDVDNPVPQGVIAMIGAAANLRWEGDDEDGTFYGDDITVYVKLDNYEGGAYKIMWFDVGASAAPTDISYVAHDGTFLDFGYSPLQPDPSSDAEFGLKIVPNPAWEEIHFTIPGHSGASLSYLHVDTICIPAPGAILLGSIGIGLVGWLRRRRSL